MYQLPTKRLCEQTFKSISLLSFNKKGQILSKTINNEKSLTHGAWLFLNSDFLLSPPVATMIISVLFLYTGLPFALNVFVLCFREMSSETFFVGNTSNTLLGSKSGSKNFVLRHPLFLK